MLRNKKHLNYICSTIQIVKSGLLQEEVTGQYAIGNLSGLKLESLAIVEVVLSVRLVELIAEVSRRGCEAQRAPERRFQLETNIGKISLPYIANVLNNYIPIHIVMIIVHIVAQKTLF